MDTEQRTGILLRLHTVPLEDVGKRRPALDAWNDLEYWREMLRGMTTGIPGNARPMVLGWLRGWRVYLLERNHARWRGDGLFHVLDRDYLPWRRHTLAFSRDELLAAFNDAACEWPRTWTAAENIYSVMADDCFFKARRRPYLDKVDEILRGLCHAALTRAEAEHVQVRGLLP